VEIPLGREYAGVAKDLEALKLFLIAMRPDQLAADQARTLADEISSIRLQLKRLEADREWVKEIAARATSSPVSGEAPDG